jgi:hypothetical protein
MRAITDREFRRHFDRSGHRIRGGLRVTTRCKSERGASLTEFALVLPILALMLFGIIDFGVAFNDYQSIRQGVRDGARQGVVSNFGSSEICGLGALTSSDSNAKKLICTTKDRTGLGTDTRVKILVLDGVDDVNDTFAKGNRLLVCTQRKLESATGFFSVLLNGKYLQSKVLMRIEKSTPILAATEEAPPSGGSWTFCSA